MKNIKPGIFAVVLLTIGLSSCIEHEVIPAPEPTVDLQIAEFEGTINGTYVHLTENVSGYYVSTEKAKILLPPPQLSSAVYFSEILSAESPVSIKIGLGSVMWDASTTSDPTLTQYNNFLMNTLTPVFALDGNNGFEVRYKDGLGVVWVSNQASVNFQDVIFSDIKQESDASGDYSQFTCDFECYVYHTDPVTLELDSVRIQASEYKAWFKR